MSGNVVVDRSKEVAFPRSSQPPQGIPVDIDGNEDLYSKLKALEKQLEFLEIQVSFLFNIDLDNQNVILCLLAHISVR